MANLRVLIADDEPLARRGVRQLLAPHADLIVVGEARNGAETLGALDAIKPDLLFLDVQMPEMDGFAVIRARGVDRMPPLVFVTAHDQFAVQAFEAHALDYLVKPLKVERFEACLKRLRQRFTLLRAAELAAKLKGLLAAERAERQKRGMDRLIVPTSMGALVIPSREIDWIGADDYYACLHVGLKTYLLRESLTSLAARLDSSQFVRLHRGAIVRLDRITEVRASIGADVVVLRDGTHVPVSRRKRAMLDELLRRGS
ncbi:MAG: response regulator transcription factor [Acidobacteriaceae bacterium]|nr:response regulator transcription factor [Acidobacteriaceae bacterium]MBV9307154.1 response regulator transcription factor [Acidobacteriaceae bacterium]